ncbi:MAG: tRNA-binding protein [Desulfobulbus sp.]|nr:tRNA-binding protein [Desulfobulbus sp.]
MKKKASYDLFASLEIRVGTIVSVKESKTRKPTWKMVIDFGEDIGTRISCGAYTNYETAELTGMQVICVANLGTMKMSPENSEVLVLGVAAENGGPIPLTTHKKVRNGQEIF